MMRKCFFNIALFIVVLAVVSCRGSHDDRTDRRKSGIVSLAPSITKQLLLLGAGGRIAGHTSYCGSENLGHSEIVASQMVVDVEKIAIIRPESVLCTTLTRADVREKLEKLGMHVACFKTPASFEQICDQFIEIARVVDKGKKAVTVVDREKARVAAIRKKIPDGPPRKIMIEIGTRPLFAATPGYFMHDFISLAGGRNIAADSPGGRISRERVLIENPDVIVIVNMGMVGQEEKEKWLSYDSLSAARSGKIHVIDADMACSPTPVTFVDVLEELVTFMYD